MEDETQGVEEPSTEEISTQEPVAQEATEPQTPAECNELLSVVP